MTKKEIMHVASEQGTPVGPDMTRGEMLLAIRQNREDHLATPMITWGKYKGTTYQDLYLTDPPYCQWVVETARVGDNVSKGLKAFANWLEQERNQVPVIPANPDKPPTWDGDDMTYQAFMMRLATWGAEHGMDPFPMLKPEEVESQPVYMSDSTKRTAP